MDGDDDGLEAESQDSRSECRRCREDGYIERGVDQEGHEAEESPLHKGAMRARGAEALEVQGVQRLSARSYALSVQGVRWEGNLRARSSARYMQGVFLIDAKVYSNNLECYPRARINLTGC